MFYVKHVCSTCGQEVVLDAYSPFAFTKLVCLLDGSALSQQLFAQGEINSNRNDNAV